MRKVTPTNQYELYPLASPDLLTEQDVEWYPVTVNNDYIIHRSGEIVDTVKGKPLKQYWGGRGYQVNLRVNDTLSGHTALLVAALVADVYCFDNNEHHDTLVFLDGDRHNHAAYNLCWRSRSYAIRYHREISQGEQFRTLYAVVDSDDIVYDNVLEAAIANGVWPTQIIESILNDHPVQLVETQFYATKPPEHYGGDFE